MVKPEGLLRFKLELKPYKAVNDNEVIASNWLSYRQVDCMVVPYPAISV